MELIIALDTNAYIDWRAKGAWKDEIATADRILIPSTVLGELHYGFLRGTETRLNLQRLRQFLLEPQIYIADISSSTSEIYGQIHFQLRQKGKPIPSNDMWIAASTIEHNALLLTRDQHFQFIDGLAYQFPQPMNP